MLTTEKAAIQEEARAAAQKRLNDYRAGVLLSTVNIESVTPPPEAADAFRDVASARADTARIVSEAEGYANDLIPKARGAGAADAGRVRGLPRKKINEALGDAARFNQIAAEYAKAPEVTGRRLYLETMEQVLPRDQEADRGQGRQSGSDHHSPGYGPEARADAAMKKDRKAQVITIVVISLAADMTAPFFCRSFNL